MNALATQQTTPFRGSSEVSALTVELGKILGLVAPSSMSSDQQTIWLASAVDALQGIRAAEVAHISAEVRRKVKRHNEIVPEIARLVAERRSSRSGAAYQTAPLPEVKREPGPPLNAKEIASMPKWLKDTGLRIGFLVRDGDRLVDVEA